MYSLVRCLRILHCKSQMLRLKQKYYKNKIFDLFILKTNENLFLYANIISSTYLKMKDLYAYKLQFFFFFYCYIIIILCKFLKITNKELFLTICKVIFMIYTFSDVYFLYHISKPTNIFFLILKF